MSHAPAPGSIGWIDLTIDDASTLRDFYQSVVGWSVSEVSMGAYADFCMHPAGEGAGPVAGICHATGPNSGVPPVWLIYITVTDLDASLAHCSARGGEVVAGPRSIDGSGRMAVIRDPAGACCALFEHGASGR